MKSFFKSFQSHAQPMVPVNNRICLTRAFVEAEKSLSEDLEQVARHCWLPTRLGIRRAARLLIMRHGADPRLSQGPAGRLTCSARARAGARAHESSVRIEV